MHRALRDWPAGGITPRLRRVVARDARATGGLCACSRVTAAGRFSS